MMKSKGVEELLIGIAVFGSVLASMSAVFAF